jgi:hypothetical protein
VSSNVANHPRAAAQDKKCLVDRLIYFTIVLFL